MSNLTLAQIQARWAQIQADFAQRGTSNRAGTYFDIARLYSDIGTPEALRASRQIMMQAQITSYSGAIGAAALIGNRHAQMNNPSRYTMTLDAFSFDILNRLVEAIDLNIDQRSNAILSIAEINALDYSVWRQYGMGEWFPGNYLRGQVTSAGFLVPENSIIYESDLYLNSPLSTSTAYTEDNPGFVFLRGWESEDLWSAQMVGTTHFWMASNVAAFANDLGNRVGDFGLSLRAIRESGSQTSGGYTGELVALAVDGGVTIEAVVVKDAFGNTVMIRQFDDIAALYGESGWAERAGAWLGEAFVGGMLSRSPMAGPDFGVFQREWQRAVGELEDEFKNRLGADMGGIRHYLPDIYDPDGQFDPECFLPGTPVQMADGGERAIETIQVGDRVMAFDENGALRPATVSAVHTNTSDSIIDLDGRVFATPGHRFLCHDGEFRTLQDAIAHGSALVNADGSPQPLKAPQVLRADALMAEPVGAPGAAETGRIDLDRCVTRDLSGKPTFVTHNLTVEEAHTFIAASFRVHNDSLRWFIPEGGVEILNLINSDGEQVILGAFADGRVFTVRGRDYDGDGKTDLALRDYFLRDGSRVRQGSEARVAHYNGAIIPRSDLSGMFGTIGSSIGTLLGNGNVAAELAGSSVLQAIGVNLGQFLSSKLNTVIDHVDGVTKDVFSDFGTDLSDAFQGAAVGSISSYLAMELGEALNLNGFGAELFETANSTLISTVLSNAAAGQSLFAGLAGSNPTFQVLDGIVTPDLRQFKFGAFEQSIGAFLGSKLGSLIIQPETTAGAVLSSIGSSIGSLVFTGGIGAWSSTFSFGLTTSLSRVFGAAANFIVPGIGSLIGFVLGAFVGNLFGRKKPRIPSANAETVLSFDTGYYELGGVSAQNGGNEALVRDMAEAARDTLNGLIATVTYHSEIAGNANLTSPTQVYGHTSDQMWVRLGSHGAAKQNFSKADEAVDRGALWAIGQTKIVGGDIYMKRALENSKADSVIALAGDLQIAEDYGLYVREREVINTVLAEPYESLDPADRSFYDANKARITRVMAKDSVVLNASDQAWYDANILTVDRIIAGLSVTQFAAGWIITLQRAAELGLHQTAESDLYGGMAGLMDSLRLQTGQALDPEAIGFAWSGDTLELRLDSNGDGRAAAGDALVFELGEMLARTGYTEMTNQPGAEMSADAARQLAQGSGGFVTIDAIELISWSGGDNTAGGDIIIHTGANGVTIEDRHVETILVEEEEYDWGGYGFIVQTSVESVVIEGGDDIFVGGSGADVLRGFSGDDWLHGGHGGDRLFGGTGDDTLIAGGGAWTNSIRDELFGDAGDDHLVGGALNDRLYGGAGDDALVASAGWDRVDGEAGDDTLIAHWDASGGDGDHMIGGDGSDTLSFERFGVAVTADLQVRDLTGIYAGILRQDSIENLTGSAHNDWLRGDSGANGLRGGAGDDTLQSRGGDDILEGGAGADQLIGAGGFDYAAYSGSSGAVWIDLAAGEMLGADAVGDTFSGIEGLIGSAFDDTFFGVASVADSFYGGRGDDWFVATTGADEFFGEAGFDTVDYADYTGAVSVNLTTGLGYFGAAGHRYAGIEQVVGGSGADVLAGSSRDEVFQGGAGNDTLSGGAGMDTYLFFRGDGSDTIHEADAGYGYDTLIFGDGIAWDDLWIGTPNAGLQINIDGSPGDQVWVPGNFTGFNIVGTGIDALDVGGAGAIDIAHINLAAGGGSGADVVVGRGDRHDLLMGYAGNDRLEGAVNKHGHRQSETNSNIFWGGRGNDVHYASSGDDQYIFERGDGVDTIYDTGGQDRIQFGAGVAAEDVIFEVVGADLVIGVRDAADPTRAASQVADRIIVKNAAVSSGLAMVEFVTAGGVDIDLTKLDLGGGPTSGGSPGDIRGTNGADTLNGTFRADTISGLGGNDTLEGSLGDDRLDGGSGTDRAVFQGALLDYTLRQNADGTLGVASDVYGADTLINIEELRFEGEGRTYSVQEALDLSNGGSGGGEGPDPGPGVDVHNGTGSDDSFDGSSRDDHFIGAGGADQFRGREGDDIYDGGAGSDVVILEGALSEYSFTINGDGTFASTHADQGADTYISIEGLWLDGERQWYNFGRVMADLATGTGAGGAITGGTGDDELFGTAGSDTFQGGGGDDEFYGGRGDDVYDGGSGSDLLNLNGALSAYVVTDEGGGAVRFAHADWGSHTVTNVEGVWFLDEAAWYSVTDALAIQGGGPGDGGGGPADIIFTGTASDDELTDGDDRNETFRGLGGDDLFRGRGGDDRYDGAAGYDTVILEGALADYSFVENGDGSVSVTHVGGDIDTFIDIEGIWFDGEFQFYQVDEALGLQNPGPAPGGQNTLTGTNGDDLEMFLDDGDTTFVGLAGEDVFRGYDGNDVYDGGADYDTVILEGSLSDYQLTRNADGSVTVRHSTDGVDTLIDIEGIWFDIEAQFYSVDEAIDAQGQGGQPSGNVLDGTNADDDIYGGSGNETLRGFGGDDFLIGNGGDDRLEGGTGYDTAVFDGQLSDHAFEDLGGGQYRVFTSAGDEVLLDSIEAVNFTGSWRTYAIADAVAAGASTLVIHGTSADDILSGTTGSDAFYGYGGDDQFIGEGGGDTFFGGAGYDQVNYDGYRADYTFTENGDGTVTVTHATFGQDTFDSIEWLWFYDESAWYSVADILSASSQSTAFSAAPSSVVRGPVFSGGPPNASSGAQSFSPASLGGDVFGTAGDDSLEGGSGDDTLHGLDGDDTLRGRGGDDVLLGGAGYDTAILEGHIDAYHLFDNGNGTYSAVQGGGETDTLDSIEGIWFDGQAQFYALNDALNAMGDVIAGGAGDDALTGTSGSDRLFGYAGSDTFDGSAGDDRIDGGRGYDQVEYNGALSDYTFRINTRGVVTAEHASNGTDTLIGIEGFWFHGEQAWYSIGEALSASTGSSVVLGDEGSNFLTGSGGNDDIYGLDGNDDFYGLAGNDRYFGGEGDDLAVYDDALTDYTLLSLADGALAVESAMFGRDTLYSIEAFWFNGSQTWYSVEDAIDAIGIRVTASVEGGYRSGGDGADIFVGSTGDDDFYGGLGDDVYFGGEGFDQVFFDGALTDLALVANADGSVQASGPGGQTDLFSSIEGLWFDGEQAWYSLRDALSAQNPVIQGTSGDDSLEGDGSSNTLVGGDGEDALRGRGGADVYDAGLGFDTVVLEGGQADYTFADHGDGRVTAAHTSGAVSTLFDVEAIWFDGDQTWFTIEDVAAESQAGPRVLGGDGHDRLTGSSGNDILRGFAGEDVLRGGEGSDTLSGGAGFDVAAFSGRLVDYIVTASSDGGFTITSGAGDTDRLVSVEALSFDGASGVISLALAAALNPGGLALIDGTAQGDALEGSAGADALIGGGGDDVLRGYAGADYADGGAGYDTLVLEGALADYTFARDRHGYVTISHASDADRVVTGVEAISFVTGQTIHALDGLLDTTGPRSLVGTADADFFDGASGSETMSGGGGDDELRGRGGDDIYNGGAGYDTAILEGDLAHYRFTRQGDGSVLATHHSGEVDTLVDIEALWFAGEQRWHSLDAALSYTNPDFFSVIGFDLADDGLDLVSVDETRVVFESDSGGPLMRSGWIGDDDAILALDRNSDGLITRRSEISFVNDLAGASTSLAALAAFDTNGDGVFDASDADWSNFRVWTDANQNGVGSASELQTFADLGVSSISFSIALTGAGASNVYDNTVLGSSQVNYSAGGSTQIHDVALARRLAHIGGFIAGVWRSEWASYDADADGDFGVGRTTAQLSLPEDALANLAQIFLNTTEADLAAPVQDLHLHQDLDDSLAPPASQAQTGLSFITVKDAIIVDLDGDGVEPIAPGQSSVRLDVDGDGARDRLGWVGPDDALLVVDRDANGVISLMDETLAYDGLAALDGNGDGRIDAADDAYGDLLLWRDADLNGVSVADELGGLAGFGIESVHLTPADGAAPLAIGWADGVGGRASQVTLNAFRGDLEQQAISEVLRQLRMEQADRGAFDRSARWDQFTAPPPGAEPAQSRLAQAGWDGSRSTQAGPIDTPSVLIEGGEGAEAEFGSDATFKAEPLAQAGRARPVAAPSLDQPMVLSARSDFDPAPNAASQAPPRWWLADLHHGGLVEPRENALRVRLERLRQARGLSEPVRSAEPGGDAEATAERDRLLQAMAAFRGASGVPVLTRHDPDQLNTAQLAHPGRSALLRASNAALS